MKAVCVVVCVLALSMLVPASGSAEPDSVILLAHRVSKTCLHANKSGELYLSGCRDGNADWHRDGEYLEHVNTGRCLSEDAEGHGYVLAAVCDGSAESRWARVDAKFWKNNKTGACLDSDGTKIYPHQCNKSAYQTWQQQTP